MQDIAANSFEDGVVEECDNCENWKQKYISSQQENAEMRVEMARLTGKLDNIRRLQEMGMINSFPTTAQTEKPIKGEDAAQIVSITGQGTMRSNKA